MDAPRPSVVRSTLAHIGHHGGGVARAAVLVLCIGAASTGAPAARGASAAQSGAALAAAAPPPVIAPDTTTERDVSQFGAVALFVEKASEPTVVPSPTPVPSPAPAPTQAAPPAPAAPSQAPDFAPPPAEQPAPPPLPAAAPATPWGLDTAPMDAPAQQLFDDTNGRRASVGLPPLRVNGYLIGIARIRSHDMADHNYFAHVSPITGDDAFSLMDKHGVPYGWAGENLAKNNYPDSQCVSVADVALWNSPHHRENILNPNYTDMGIALVIDPTGMKYFTVIFTGPA